MSNLDELHGAAAFQRGKKRSENPHGIDAPKWMDWMDGFDHAQTQAELHAAVTKIAAA